MPTGYTAMIDDNPKLSTEQWIMTGLARAFGICVTLRDDDMQLSEEVIKKRIASDSQSDIRYHKRELTKAQKEAKAIATRTEQEWQNLWSAEEADKVKDECEPYIQEPKTIEDFKQAVVKDNTWHLNYHKEELSKATKRRDDRVKLYAQLKKDVVAALNGNNLTEVKKP